MFKTLTQFTTQLFDPYKYSEKVDFKNSTLTVFYTKRAKKIMQQQKNQLIVEMQIYFSCVVQKRVIFHDTYEGKSVAINEKIAVAVRAVESDRCDPVYFAENHPVKKEYTSPASNKMKPKELYIDYKEGKWIGSFSMTSKQSAT